MPAAAKKKPKASSVTADELFRLFDSNFKEPKFYAALERYLASGGNPDAPHPGFYGNDTSRGTTLLENAIIPGDVKTVKLLLEAGADVHRKTAQGETYFERAASQPRLLMMLEKAAGLRGDKKSLVDELELLLARAGYTTSYGVFRSAARKKSVLSMLARRPNAADELVEVLVTHTDVRVTSAAAESLALLGEIDKLRAALVRVTSAQLTRRWIAHAFADLGARSDLEALVARGDDVNVLSQLLAMIPR